MTEAEKQILINRIMIMEGLINILRKSNGNDIARRNLEICTSATYDFLEKNRSE